MICLYRGEWKGRLFALKDDPERLSFFKNTWEKYPEQYADLVKEILSIEAIWGENMAKVPELVPAIAGFLELIDQHGMEEALTYLLHDIS